MNKRSGPAVRPGRSGDALRDRFLTKGSEGFSVPELLAVCLHSVAGEEREVLFCTHLLTAFGDLDGLLQATVAELLQIRGMDTAKIAALKAVHELSLRGWEEAMQRSSVRCPQDAGVSMNSAQCASRYLQRRLAGLTHEVFGCLFLDTHHRLIQFEVLFQGSINRAPVYPRELIRRSIELNAAAIVLSHNHPSGVAEPSLADIELTRDLLELMNRVDVQVLDHIIVARGQTVSLASRGLITR